MRAAVANLRAVPRGMLRVHARVLVDLLPIAPALPRFLAANPEVQVDLPLSNAVADPVERQVDVDVRIGALADPGLIARRLATTGASSAPRHPSLHGTPRRRGRRTSRGATA